jgi:hypothetical protein
MDMDDNDRLARLERKIDGIERKIDDLTILANSVVWASAMAYLISTSELGWVKEHRWWVVVATFLVATALFQIQRRIWPGR